MVDLEYIGLSLHESQYPDTGAIVEGIPQIIPNDGWYWLQRGRGRQVQWSMCYIVGTWIMGMDALYDWSEPTFHAHYRLGPAVPWPERREPPL